MNTEFIIKIKILEDSTQINISFNVDGDNLAIDWDDNSNIETYISNEYNTHTYDIGDYIIKIYGITNIRDTARIPNFNKPVIVEEIIVPETVKSIGALFLYQVNYIKNVVLPYSLESIGNYFGRGATIEKVYFNGIIPPTVQSSTFNNIQYKLIVPDISTYMNKGNFPREPSRYETLPLVNNILSVYHYLKNILEEEFDMVIDDSQNGDVHGLTTLINKIDEI